MIFYLVDSEVTHCHLLNILLISQFNPIQCESRASEVRIISLDFIPPGMEAIRVF